MEYLVIYLRYLHKMLTTISSTSNALILSPIVLFILSQIRSSPDQTQAEGLGNGTIHSSNPSSGVTSARVGSPAEERAKKFVHLRSSCDLFTSTRDPQRPTAPCQKNVLPRITRSC